MYSIPAYTPSAGLSIALVGLFDLMENISEALIGLGDREQLLFPIIEVMLLFWFGLSFTVHILIIIVFLDYGIIAANKRLFFPAFVC